MAGKIRGRWQDWVNLFLGIWLFLAPAFSLAPSAGGVIAWNGYIFGAAVALFAGWALARPQRWEEWINLIIGLWLIAAPFTLGFSGDSGATWNHVVVGVVVGGDALWAMMASQPVQRAV